MVVAVITLGALLLTVAVAARRSRPRRAAAELLDGGNVVSLDDYRRTRFGTRATSVRPKMWGAPRSARVLTSVRPQYEAPAFEYPLSATAGGGSGLRTCRQPDGRFVRPASRIEPV